MLQHLRLALRGFTKNPGFTLVAVLTLALGIGANTAIFSVLDAVLLRPLPLPDSDALVVVGQNEQRGGRPLTVSYTDSLEWRRAAHSLTELAAWHDETFTLGGGAHPQTVRGIASSANIFKTLGVAPVLGRGFAAGEDQAGKNRVVVLSHGAWNRYLGGDPGAVGRAITLDDLSYTVIGVLPPDFRFPTREEEFDAWVPIPRPWDEAMIPQRAASYLSLVGRLGPGQGMGAAQAELDAEVARQAAAFPRENSGRVAIVRSLHGQLVAGVRPALVVLFVAVGFVLLLACANVANLLLARATARAREIAIRRALGATRRAIVGQLLVESVALGVAGGALGVVLALWGLDALRALIPRAVAAIRPIGIDGGVLLFTLGVAVATGVVFGLVPALYAAAVDPHAALKETDLRLAGRHRARSVLVAAEVAFAAVLLVGAGLTLKSFHVLGRVDPGFAVRDVVTTTLTLPDARYHQNVDKGAFYHALLGRLDAQPGAAATAIGFPLPFSGGHLTLAYHVDGTPPAEPGQEPSLTLTMVSPRWFAALAIPLVAGRAFTAADDGIDAPPVVIVSQALAHAIGGDALGKRMTINWGKQESYEIVGVAGDTRGDSLDAPPVPSLYMPFGRTPFPVLSLIVRTPLVADWTKQLAATVQSVDGGLPIQPARTLAAAIHDSLARQRLTTLLLGLFGALALLLALVGVYGVMSYSVSQRRHEIGIRAALGAGPRRVARMIVAQALALAGAGIAVGLAAALALARALDRLLYGVASTDPVVYAGIAALLLALATFAAWLPARRAARVDPMVALRS